MGRVTSLVVGHARSNHRPHHPGAQMVICTSASVSDTKPTPTACSSLGGCRIEEALHRHLIVVRRDVLSFSRSTTSRWWDALRARPARVCRRRKQDIGPRIPSILIGWATSPQYRVSGLTNSSRRALGWAARTLRIGPMLVEDVVQTASDAILHPAPPNNTRSQSKCKSRSPLY